MARPRPPAAGAPTAVKTALHPRNRHRHGYDFAALVSCLPALAACLRKTPDGRDSIDFADAGAVRLLNRALLRASWDLDWDIPAGALCPPVPGRADYLHYLADLLAADNGGRVPAGDAVRVLDIGTGANCIYPLLGHAEYGWQFVASELDAASFAAAQRNLDANPAFARAIELRRQTQARQIFHGIIRHGERFQLTLCNPPFHASAAEAAAGSQRKLRNLGRATAQQPALNFGGRSNELWCEGGEAGFVSRMIDESREYAAQVLWFTCLISKAENLRPLQQRLRDRGVASQRVIDMAQGQKKSRFLAWTWFE